jgi:hypothetical protein
VEHRDKTGGGLRTQAHVLILLLAIIVIGAGEEMWMRFVPKYFQALGAVPFVIGFYDGSRRCSARFSVARWRRWRIVLAIVACSALRAVR